MPTFPDNQEYGEENAHKYPLCVEKYSMILKYNEIISKINSKRRGAHCLGCVHYFDNILYIYITDLARTSRKQQGLVPTERMRMRK